MSEYIRLVFNHLMMETNIMNHDFYERITLFRQLIPECLECGDTNLVHVEEVITQKVPDSVKPYTNWETFECENCHTLWRVETWFEDPDSGEPIEKPRIIKIRR